MDDFFRTAGMVLLILVLALAVPIGIAMAVSWTPRETSSVLTGGAAICGGALAVAAIAGGLAFGLSLARRRQPDEPHPPPTYSLPPRNDYDLWRAQKAMLDAQRAQVALERDRQSLLPPPADSWQAEGWNWIDATQEPSRHPTVPPLP